jgi:hypothetical protein
MGTDHFWRTRRRCEDIIRMSHRDAAWEGVEWLSDSGDGPLAGSCESDNEPLGSMKDCGKFPDYSSDYQSQKNFGPCS